VKVASASPSLLPSTLHEHVGRDLAASNAIASTIPSRIAREYISLGAIRVRARKIAEEN